MERRALIAVIISVVILIVYQEFVIKRFFPPGQAAPEAVEPPPPAAREPEAAAPSPATLAPPEAPSAAPAVAGSDVTVETDLYHAVFTTAGGRLKSLQLKHYRTTVDADSPPLQLVQYPVDGHLPLGVALRGPQQQVDDAAVLYRSDRSELDLLGAQDGSFTLEGELGGAAIRKVISVRNGTYQWEMAVDATNVPPAFTQLTLGWDEGVTPVGPTTNAEVVFDTVEALQNGKLVREPFTGLDAGTLLKDNIAWTAFGGHYFVAALVPDLPDDNALQTWSKRTQQTVESQLLFPPGVFSQRVGLYVGPKDIDRLEEAGHGLRRAVDLGFFSFVALPMLQGLRFLHRFTGNYGAAIIVLTVLVKVLFFPLTRKSFESMKAMQKLQPEMAKIKERLKDKPDEMNREVMELYRRHKVNPLGGCLPMLLQLPVFIGLYSALQNAIELRHAPFIGWIHDLSAPDRLGMMQLPFVQHPGIPVLTLTMGVTMFLQQWMTPSAADPAQQRAMMIMPLMFTFMFINFPAGLTLYWLVNNLLTIGQQYMMMRAKQR